MIEPQVGLQLVVLTDFYCFFFNNTLDSKSNHM